MPSTKTKTPSTRLTALTFTGLHDAGFERPIPLHPFPESKRPFGEKWNETIRSREQYEQLDASEFGIGICCQNVVGLDIDITDPEYVKRIEKLIRKTLKLPKDTPRRVGRAPKCLLVVRIAEPYPSFDVSAPCKVLNDKGETVEGHRALFQLLGDRKQFVAKAIHPDTGQPYTWPTELPARHADLPLVTTEQLDALRDTVAEGLTKLGYIVNATRAHREHNGAAHWSDLHPWTEHGSRQAADALAKLDPNMCRADWVKVGQAIADGTHGSEAGFALWDGWSSESTKYRKREMRSQWKSFKPGPITKASLFKNEYLKLAGQVLAISTEPPKLVREDGGDADGTTLATLAVREVKPLQWVVEGVAAPGAMLLVGRPKGGKTLLTTDMVFAVGNGAEFLGRKSRKGHVLWIASEDDDDTLARTLQKRGVVDVPDGVRVFTGEQLVALSAKWEPEAGQAKMMLHQYVDSYLKRHPLCLLVIVDTQATAEARWGGDSAADSELKRSKSVVRSAYAGARVYQDVGLKRGACIVLVSHSRKRNGKDVSDYHELINMPQTVVAGVASSVVLADLPDADPHEPSPKRVLAVRGRHAPDSTQQVTLGADLRFTLDGDYRDVARSALHNEIMASIEALQGTTEEWVALGDVAAECGSTVNSVKVALARMRKTPGGLLWKGRVLESRPGRKGGVRFVLRAS